MYSASITFLRHISLYFYTIRNSKVIEVINNVLYFQLSLKTVCSIKYILIYVTSSPNIQNNFFPTRKQEFHIFWKFNQLLNQPVTLIKKLRFN